MDQINFPGSPSSSFPAPAFIMSPTPQLHHRAFIASILVFQEWTALLRNSNSYFCFNAICIFISIFAQYSYLRDNQLEGVGGKCLSWVHLSPTNHVTCNPNQLQSIKSSLSVNNNINNIMWKDLALKYSPSFGRCQSCPQRHKTANWSILINRTSSKCTEGQIYLFQFFACTWYLWHIQCILRAHIKFSFADTLLTLVKSSR